MRTCWQRANGCVPRRGSKGGEREEEQENGTMEGVCIRVWVWVCEPMTVGARIKGTDWETKESVQGVEWATPKQRAR